MKANLKIFLSLKEKKRGGEGISITGYINDCVSWRNQNKFGEREIRGHISK